MEKRSHWNNLPGKPYYIWHWQNAQGCKGAILLIQFVFMNTRVGKKYLLIPFIYIVLIALFLYLHFGAADTFKTSLDGLKITGKGKSSLHAASSGLQEIEVSFLSLTTRIDRNSSISLITPAGD
jgi:hypothetical protein